MIKNKIIQMGLIAMLGLGFYTAPARADWISHEGANVKLYVPDGWKQDVNGDGILVVNPQDESLMVMFWVIDGVDIKAVLDAFGPEFEKIVQDIQYQSEEPGEITINGMQAYYIQGTGQVEGEAADWEVAVIMADKPLIVVSIAQKGAFNRHEATLTKMVKSIKAAS
ncbi:hypothetical protein COW36_12520 [bacterium (Candidatus Blackallbacteria) CG17_big_fil_post_rev_8_21_14_2_50_48_46]|uniref:PsbP C-terminal domain-containing protein n=1 Tax=bacterium (Candidatus Blackallbacteria) CG17_big_fil_post_rev_8_21_14_2_50_48_46 TaxID=2014261 RepID=A0A2M7G3Z6_9BACT|nr:MAG: hypothetical protein COW64_02740 [bacterium (Candidatus Blackallbacteria) CG18_big_fil_WC_8_21_14_2_50_49_26]PIW16585.1 MAG: hypothetical protein COW36_12520 [bacterium (Candidatus Blackallbacteria) CG17_big_fil_post_rev_8_21_14_2_50_48_46]PIW46093.1 MAG: hypothetical protein COW20_17785 [bacterium (Candidatus Blackallbacteria) CG13_big_fil_rev_8_21_14_2_50_49_14]